MDGQIPQPEEECSPDLRCKLTSTVRTDAIPRTACPAALGTTVLE
jgi:hypothetical protein